MGDYESYTGERYPDEPPKRRRIRASDIGYAFREMMRNLMFALAVCIMGSVLFILLSLVVHGNVKW